MPGHFGRVLCTRLNENILDSRRLIDYHKAILRQKASRWLFLLPETMYDIHKLSETLGTGGVRMIIGISRWRRLC
jgi:hypothetical protein